MKNIQQNSVQENEKLEANTTTPIKKTWQKPNLNIENISATNAFTGSFNDGSIGSL